MAEPLYTEQDKRFLKALKEKGVSKDAAFAELAKQKEKRGQTNVAAPKFLQNAAGVAAGTENKEELSTAVPDLSQGVMTSTETPEEPKGNLVQQTNDLLSKVPSPQLQATLGAGKGIVEGSLNLLNMGEKAAQYISGVPKNTPTLGGAIQGNGTVKEALSTQNTTQGVSKFLGKTALPLVVGGPVTGALRAEGAAQAATMGGGKLAQAITGGALASPVETSLVTAGMEGRMPTKNEAGIGLAIDTLLPVAGVALGGGKKFLNKIVQAYKDGNLSPMAIDVANTIAKSDDATKEAFVKMGGQYSEYMKNPTKVSSPLADVGQKITDDFTNVILPEREAIGKELSAQIKEADNLAQAGGGQTSEQIVKTFTDGLDDIGVKATDTGLDFTDSTIRFSGDNQNALSKVYSNVNKFLKDGSYVPPSEKWALAQALDDLSEYNSKLASQTTATGELPLVQLKNSLVQDVKNSLSESGQAVDLFDQYASLSKIRDVLNKRLGEGGTGGFAVTKSLFGEQKFGSEVKEALDAMNAKTGVDYLEDARRAKAVGEAMGDDQVKSLLTTTSAKGFIQKAAEDALFDKTRIFEKIKASLDKDKIKYSQPLLEKIVSATAKALGVNVSD